MLKMTKSKEAKGGNKRANVNKIEKIEKDSI